MIFQRIASVLLLWAASSLCVPGNSQSGPVDGECAPKLNVKSQTKQLIVFDLDQTIYDCGSFPSEDSRKKYEHLFPGSKELLLTKNQGCMLVMRPGVLSFIQDLHGKYDLAIFTKASKILAIPALTQLGLDKYFPPEARVYRETCPGMLGKDLRIFGLDLADVLLIDDLRENFVPNVMALKLSDGRYIKTESNGILIPRFEAKTYALRSFEIPGPEKYIHDFDDALTTFDYLRRDLNLNLDLSTNKANMQKVVIGHMKRTLHYELTVAKLSFVGYRMLPGNPLPGMKAEESSSTGESEDSEMTNVNEDSA
jgi:hypothetical protein